MGAIGAVLSPSGDRVDPRRPSGALSPARAKLVRQRRRRRRVLIALTGLTAVCTFMVGLADV